MMGVSIGVVGRFLSHWISGIVFWYMFTPEGITPMLYSTIYNGSYMAGELIVSAIIIHLLLKRSILNIEM